MHICYLDESGNYIRKGTTSHFILMGLVIPATSWRAHDAEVAQVMRRHDLEDVEVHTGWMARRYPEQERIPDFETLDPVARRKAVTTERKIDLGKAALKQKNAVKVLSRNYKKSAAYVHLTHAERMSVLRTLADLIGTWSDTVLFADAQDKTAHSTADDEGILDFAFEQVVSRFHHFLERSDLVPGMLVQDQNDTASTRLTRLARRYHERGTPWATYTRIVETPLFVDSALTSMVQLADLCAYSVRRFFENGETDLFDRIYSRFDRSAGKLVGLRHYTGKAPCSCRVCVDHGR